MAERLFSARIDPVREVAVASAGTAGVTGFPMDGAAAQVLVELGGSGEGHVARRLSPAMIAGSDLFLTGVTMHRSQVVLADPMAFRRVFTLREFGRLGAELEAPTAATTDDELRARVREVAAQRGQGLPPDEGEDEIADPYLSPLRVMRVCGQQIADAVDAAITLLGLSRVP